LNKPTAYNYALNLLSARPYSTQALHRKLIQKEYPAADADDAIRRLVDNGLLNDAKFAEQYARSKIVSSGVSKRRLSQDLYRKGIKGDVATTAIANVIADEEIDTAPSSKKSRARNSLSSVISSLSSCGGGCSDSWLGGGTTSMRSSASWPL